MRSLEMRKKRQLRSVCAPHSRSAGTSMVPKLSFSMRVPDIPPLMLRQVEEQHLGAGSVRELDRTRVGLERIARAEGSAIDAQMPARHVDVRSATLAQVERRALRAV